MLNQLQKALRSQLGSQLLIAEAKLEATSSDKFSCPTWFQESLKAEITEIKRQLKIIEETENNPTLDYSI